MTENDVIDEVDGLSLLIDKQACRMSKISDGWVITFVDKKTVKVSGLTQATILAAIFANRELAGIPHGLEELLLLADGGQAEMLDIKKINEHSIKVSSPRKNIYLYRDPEIFNSPYSIEEFFTEVGPNIQKFATGRSLAPLPRKFFVERAKEVYRLCRRREFEKIIELPPLLITIGATDLCNFRCEMCFRLKEDYIPGRYVFPDRTLRNLVLDMASFGVKALRFCGRGENMLHPKFLETLMLAKAVGLRTFIITNGTMLGRACRISTRCLDYLRVSFNALSPESYSRVHRVDEKTYFQVLNNIKAVREERSRIGSNLPIITMSSVVTKGSIVDAALGRLPDDLPQVGIDFLVLKTERPWEMTDQEKEKYLNIIHRFKKASVIVADYSGHSSKPPIKPKDWEQELGVGCAVRIVRANIDRLELHSCATENEVYGKITEQRLPEIWLSQQRSFLQLRRSRTRLRTCHQCFWGDLHRIMNYLFEQENLKNS